MDDKEGEKIMKKLLFIIGICILINTANAASSVWEFDQSNLDIGYFNVQSFLGGGGDSCVNYGVAGNISIRCKTTNAGNGVAMAISNPYYIPIASDDIDIIVEAQAVSTGGYVFIYLYNNTNYPNYNYTSATANEVIDFRYNFKGDALQYQLRINTVLVNSSIMAYQNFTRIIKTEETNQIQIYVNNSLNGLLSEDIRPIITYDLSLSDIGEFYKNTYSLGIGTASNTGVSTIDYKYLYSRSNLTFAVIFRVKDSSNIGIGGAEIQTTQTFLGQPIGYVYPNLITNTLGFNISGEYYPQFPNPITGGYRYSGVAYTTKTGYNYSYDSIDLYQKYTMVNITLVTSIPTTTTTLPPTRNQCFKFIDNNNFNNINNLSVKFEYMYNGQNYIDTYYTNSDGELDYALKSCSYNVRVIKLPDYVEQMVVNNLPDYNLYKTDGCNLLSVINSSTLNYSVNVTVYKDGALVTGNNVISIYSGCPSTISKSTCLLGLDYIQSYTQSGCVEQISKRTNSLQERIDLNTGVNYVYITTVNNLDEKQCKIQKLDISSAQRDYYTNIFYDSVNPQREICFKMMDDKCENVTNANGTIIGNGLSINFLDKERACFNSSVNVEYKYNYNSYGYENDIATFTPLIGNTELRVCMVSKDLSKNSVSISGNISIKKLDGSTELYTEDCHIDLKIDGNVIRSNSSVNGYYLTVNIPVLKRYTVTADCGKYIETASFLSAVEDRTTSNILLHESNPSPNGNRFIFYVYEQDLTGAKTSLKNAKVSLSCISSSPNKLTDDSGYARFNNMIDKEKCDYTVTKDSSYTSSTGTIDYSQFDDTEEVKLTKLSELACKLKGNAIIVNGSSREYKQGVLVNAVCNGNNINSVSTGVGGYYELAIPCNSQCIVTGDYQGVKKQVTVSSASAEGGVTNADIEITLLNMDREATKTGFMDFIYMLVPLFMSIILMFSLMVFFGIAMFITKIAGGN